MRNNLEPVKEGVWQPAFINFQRIMKKQVFAALQYGDSKNIF